MLSRIYCLVLLITVVKGQLYYISNATSGLAGARQICSLATPSIKEDGVAMDFTANYIQNISTGFKLWVGYIEILTDFHYIGCSEVTLNTTEKKILRHRDIGRCYSVCLTDFIGLLGHICICLKTLPKLHHTTCDIECDIPRGTLCGNSSSSIAVMSIYKKDVFVGLPPAGNPVNLACLSKQVPGSYGWDNCRFNKTCIYRTDPYNQTTPTTSISHTSKFNLTKSWKDCFNYNARYRLFPVKYKEEGISKISCKNGAQFWIGGVRSFQIVKMTLPNKGQIRQGYMEYTADKQFELRFKDTNSGSEKFGALCVKAIPNNLPAINQSGNIAKIALYVSVPVILLFVIGGLVAWCMVKRKKRTEHKVIDEVSYRNKTNEERGVSVSNAGYEFAYEFEDSVANTATSSDKIYNNSSDHDDATTKQRENIYNHSEVSEGTYNHGNALGIKKLKRNNLYNHIDINNEGGDKNDTYSHAVITGVKLDSTYNHIDLNNKGGDINDTYSHAVITGVKPDSSYNHIELNVNRKQDYEIDTYNHTNTVGTMRIRRHSSYEHIEING